MFPECQEAADSFLCQYYYPLRDCSSGYTYSASREECIRVTASVCSIPWMLATTTRYREDLPDCEKLPLASK